MIIAEKEHPGRPILPSRYAWGAFDATADLANTVNAAHRSTVEILGDGKPVALGLIFGLDGWVVTKRTEVVGCQRILCRLGDGRLFDAHVTGGSKEHDLSLLKVETPGLPGGMWAKAVAPRVGQLMASLGPAPRPVHFGVVGAVRVSNPAMTGYLPISGKETTPEGLAGMIFTELWKDRPDVGNLNEMLKVGDVITHVDDVPTPTPVQYLKVRDKRVAAPGALIGERIKLTIRRGEATFQVFAPIVPSSHVTPFAWKQCPLSLRRNGFPIVFAHDGGIAPEQCGGPVVSRTGEVIGINIARADEIQTLAIPIEVVQAVVSELQAKTGKQ